MRSASRTSQAIPATVCAPPLARPATLSCCLPCPPAVERAEGKAPSGGSSVVGTGEHRWGAPFPTQVALLFRRSLRTRRFQARGRRALQLLVLFSICPRRCPVVRCCCLHAGARRLGVTPTYLLPSPVEHVNPGHCAVGGDQPAGRPVLVADGAGRLAAGVRCASGHGLPACLPSGCCLTCCCCCRRCQRLPAVLRPDCAGTGSWHRQLAQAHAPASP